MARRPCAERATHLEALGVRIVKVGLERHLKAQLDRLLVQESFEPGHGRRRRRGPVRERRSRWRSVLVDPDQEELVQDAEPVALIGGERVVGDVVRDRLQDRLQVVFVFCACATNASSVSLRIFRNRWNRCRWANDTLVDQRTLRVKDLLQVRARDREDKVEVGSSERRVLDHVVRTGDWEREEMEDTVDDREKKGVEDLEEVGLWVDDSVRIRQSVGAH